MRTTAADMIVPEVMADMVSGKIKEKIVVTPFAKIDETLSSTQGDTVTVPAFDYIGDAKEVKEGEQAELSKLTSTTRSVMVKKAMKAVEISDEAVLSGYGNPVGEISAQVAKAIASKIDTDCIEALMAAPLSFDGTSTQISYTGIVDAIDIFAEELNTEKVMFVHPSQVTKLRKDANFISADKYPGSVVMTGEIGLIANTRIVASRRIKLNEAIPQRYEYCDASDDNALEIVESDAGEGTVLLATVTGDLPNAEIGQYVLLKNEVKAGIYYTNPIVVLEGDEETSDESPAITIYLKRDTNVESERVSLRRTTNISADKIYAAALTNSSKVVLAKFKK